MLKQRIITAVILIPIFLGLLFYLPPLAFCFFTAFIVMAAAYEWTSLMQVERRAMRLLYPVLMALIMGATLYTLLLANKFDKLFAVTLLIFAITFLWWLLALLLVLIYPRGAACWNGKVTKGLMGVFVLVPCWFAIIFLRNENAGNENAGIYVLLFVFILIWGADSAAYFVGKKWGKTKLAPLVSPGKSVQGVAGALLFAVVASGIAALAFQSPLIIFVSIVLLSCVTVLFSILGDLFESMLKRQAGLKDSGNILPGHGGILDRVDSLTAAAPVYALGALLLSMYFS